jgi:hypothetical protein
MYDVFGAKNILKKFNEKWVEDVLSMEKWTEKKSALEELNSEADCPKIEPGNTHYLANLIQRLMNDSNIIVV